MATEKQIATRKKNLIPFNKMSKEAAREIQVKGGQQKTEQKRFASYIRELDKNHKLTTEQKQVLAYIKENKLESASLSMIAKEYVRAPDEPGALNQAITALSKFVPNKNLNVNQHDGEIIIKWKDSKEEKKVIDVGEEEEKKDDREAE